MTDSCQWEKKSQAARDSLNPFKVRQLEISLQVLKVITMIAKFRTIRLYIANIPKIQVEWILNNANFLSFY